MENSQAKFRNRAMREVREVREEGEDFGVRESGGYGRWPGWMLVGFFEGGVAGFVQRRLAARLLTAVPP